MQAVVERHSDALFKASHAAAFGVRVQALALLLQLMTAQSAASDRFYRCGLCWVQAQATLALALQSAVGLLRSRRGPHQCILLPCCVSWKADNAVC